MKLRRSTMIAEVVGIAATVLPLACFVAIVEWFTESEAEMRSRLSSADVDAIVKWGRDTALPANALIDRWSADEFPEHLRRLGTRWAARTKFDAHDYVFISFEGNSGLLVAAPDAKCPDTPRHWSLWQPGLWYHAD